MTDGDPENHSRQLLYIEDNRSNLALVEWIMDREADIELISAMRGGHGLELAREHRPDPIVQEADRAATALGARDYLTKPLDIPRLLESIAANLNPSA